MHLDFRVLALALPQSIEQEHFGAPSFRVAGKIFAQLSADEAGGLVKLPLGLQEWAVNEHPDHCSIEPQWGRHGWTRVIWRELPPALLVEFLMASWRAVAPRKLHGLLSG